MITPDTLILLANFEYVLITEINIGDRVRTSDGYISQVEVIYARDVTEVLQVRVMGNFVLRCTPDQVLHTGSGIKLASECEKGDIIGLRTIPHLDVISWHRVSRVVSIPYVGKVHAIRISEEQSFIANSFLLKSA